MGHVTFLRKNITLTKSYLFILLIFTLIGILPALVNKSPIFFPDTFGYFSAGEASLKAVDGLSGKIFGHDNRRGPQASGAPLQTQARDGISTARSPYYGVPLVVNAVAWSVWSQIFLQSLMFSAMAILVARRLLPASGLRRDLLLAACLILGAAPFYTSTLMPDFATGCMIAALALLLAPTSPQATGERFFCFFIVVVAVCFHKANLAVALVLVPLWVVFRMVGRKPLFVNIGYPLAALALGSLGHLSVAYGIKLSTGSAPLEPPFILARVIEDGPGSRLIAQQCPELRLEICRYADRFPMRADDFLWGDDPDRSLWKTIPLESKRRISQEASEVIVRAVAHDPFAQIAASSRNFLHQLGTVGVTQYNTQIVDSLARTRAAQDILAVHRTGYVNGKQLPLDWVSAEMTAIYSLALVLIAVGLIVARQRRASLPHFPAITMLLAGLVVNAAVNGIIAGVYDRYQGRIAWLAIFLAVYLWLALVAHARSPITTTAPPAP